MSEETAAALTQSMQAEAEVRAETDRRKRECLADISANVPAKVESIAKGIALAQPDVTRGLRREGIAELRAELSREAAALASTVVSGFDKIRWPSAQSEFSQVRSRDIHQALFKYLYGPPVDKLAAVFKRYGYNTQDDNAQHSQGVVLPQFLYDETRFHLLTDALNALGKAEHATAKAKAANDRSVVEDLWGD